MVRVKEFDEKLTIRLSSEDLKRFDNNVDKLGFKHRAEVIRRLITYVNKEKEIPRARSGF